MEILQVSGDLGKLNLYKCCKCLGPAILQAYLKKNLNKMLHQYKVLGEYYTLKPNNDDLNIFSMHSGLAVLSLEAMFMPMQF